MVCFAFFLLMILVFASTSERRPSFLFCARPLLLRGRSTSLFFVPFAARLQVLSIVFSALSYVLFRSSAHIHSFLFVVGAYFRSYSFCISSSFSIPYSLFRPSTPTNRLSLPSTVPAKPGGLNISLENAPAGDDYVLISMNSTYGVARFISALYYRPFVRIFDECADSPCG
jgi:hypothetical protein